MNDLDVDFNIDTDDLRSLAENGNDIDEILARHLSTYGAYLERIPARFADLAFLSFLFALKVPFSKVLLYYAARSGNDAAIAYMLDRGGNLNRRVEPDIFIRAVQSCKKSTIRSLIFRGAGVNQKAESALVPLHFVTSAEAVETLAAHGADINAMSTGYSIGLAPLHFALRKVDVCRALLEHGADIDMRKLPTRSSCEYYTVSPLHRAAETDCVDAARLLIAHRANIESRGRQGGTRTPLMSARENYAPKVAWLLKQHGAYDPPTET